MKLLKLQLNDFLSHKNTVIEFHPNRKVLIDGRSGSGKTAIVEGIIWCLFGKGRLDNRALVRNGQSSGYVDVSLGDVSDKWTIRRKTTAKGSQTIDISHDKDGKSIAIPATSVKEKQDFIEKEILKCSYELFINSVVYPQDGSQNFVKQTAVKRKELLLEIIGAGNFDTYLSKAKSKAVEIENEISMLSSKIDTSFDHLNKSTSRLEEVNKSSGNETVESLEKKISLQKTEVEALDQTRKKSIEARDQLKKKVDAQEQARKQIKFLRENLRPVKDTTFQEDRIKGIESMEAQVPILKETLRSEKERISLSKEAKEKGDRLAVQLITAGNFNRDTKKRLSELENQLNSYIVPESDICPATNRICPKVAEYHEKRKKEISLELEALKSTLEISNQEVRRIQDDIKNLSFPVCDQVTVDLLEKKLNEISQLTNEKIGLVVEVRMNKDAISQNLETNKKIEKLTAVASEDDSETLASAHQEVEFEEKAWEISVGKLSVLEQDLAFIKAVSSEKSHLLQEIAGTEELIGILTAKKNRLTDSLDCVRLIKDAFGANGIKVVVIDTILPGLERRINEILSELSDFKIRLDTQKDNASTDGKKEGLFITIINDQGEEMDFDGYSGGEKLKIVVSISEALAELQKTEFRIIDELFIGLDEESVGQFGEVLMRLQERFSQVLCISHIPQIKELFEDTIEIKKTNGISAICP